MMFHFMYNLMIHVVAINPSDNDGSMIPYAMMFGMEIAVLAALILGKNAKCNKKNRSNVI